MFYGILKYQLISTLYTSNSDKKNDRSFLSPRDLSVAYDRGKENFLHLDQERLEKKYCVSTSCFSTLWSLDKNSSENEIICTCPRGTHD